MSLHSKLKYKFLKDVQALSNKHNISLYRKFIKENDMANLKSLIAEANFGLFFDQHCQNLKYDVPIFSNSKKTPDWLVGINGQTIVAEVYKLNPAQKDQLIADAESEAIEEYRKNNPGVPVIGSFHSITQQPLKLEGDSGVLISKSSKYGNLVENDDLPFLICLDFAFNGGPDATDLFNSLYGKSTEFVYPSNYQEHYYIGAPFHTLEDALYYENEQIRKNVSGVLLRIEGGYIYYHNPNPANRLNKANTNWLMKFSREYDEF